MWRARFRIAAIQVLDELDDEALGLVVLGELEMEEAIRRREDRRVAVVARTLLERGVVDRDLALQDQRAQLGVERAPHLRDLLEAGREQRPHPRPQRDDIERVLRPAVEIEAADELRRRRQREQLARVLEADLVHELEHFIRRQRRDRGGRVVGRQQRVDAARAARPRELLAQAAERADRRWIAIGHGLWCRMPSTPVDRAVRAVRRAVARAVAEGAPALFGVACSGGADSMALADATIAIAGARHVIIFIIDHAMQSGSDAIAERVAAWARGQGAAAIVRRARVEGRSEAAARRARYAALDELAAEVGCVEVLLGHTQRDQAETVLMRIVRGTGPAGLAGMPAVRQRFARPLRSLRRADIDAYCAARALPVWDDPMNDDRDFLRVRARAEWMPLLARSNPKIEEALVRLADQAREWRDVIDARAAEFARPIECTTLAAELPAIRKRVVALLLEASGLGYTAAHLDAADGLVCAPRRGTVSIDVPGGRIVRVYDRVEIELDAAAGDVHLHVADLDLPPGHILRTWQPGDRMKLPRLAGHSRKLSDLYADLRVPRSHRASARVLVRVADDEIVWAEHVGHAVGPARSREGRLTLIWPLQPAPKAPCLSCRSRPLASKPGPFCLASIPQDHPDLGDPDPHVREHLFDVHGLVFQRERDDGHRVSRGDREARRGRQD